MNTGLLYQKLASPGFVTISVDRALASPRINDLRPRRRLIGRFGAGHCGSWASSDSGIQPRGCNLLLEPRCREPLHLLLKQLPIVLHLFRTHIAAGREHVAMLTNVVELRCFAEAGHIGVLARVLVTAPSVIGAGDLREILIGELAMYPVYQGAHLAGVDEERLAAPVAEAAVLLIARQEPQADRDLRGVEELAR